MELYGTGRILEASNGFLRNLNIKGLRALDLRTHKDDCTPWDFNNSVDRKLALHLVESLQPAWIIGSPPCTAFSLLNINLNFPRMPEHIVQQKIAEGVRRIHFVLSLYKIQMDGNRFFLHEHPACASSWQDPWMLRLLQQPKVVTVVAHQCMYGLVTHTRDGEWVPAQKPT